MRDETYNATILEYEKKRTKNEIQRDKRRQDLYEKYPRLEAIAKELNSLGLKLAKSIGNESTSLDSISSFDDSSRVLIEEKNQILTNNGYPLDYLEIGYDCDLCQDTGIYNGANCSCFTKSLISKYYQQSQLSNILMMENFDTFNLNYYDEDAKKHGVSPKLNIQNIFLKACKFVQNFDEEYTNLYLYGNSGLGKTFISHCIAKDLLDKGNSVIYQTATDLIDSIRNNKFNQNIQKNIVEYLYECDLLIIDDLGTENLTEFANNELFNLINRRLMNRKSNVISTNLSLNELQGRYNSRLTSRIMGNFTFLKFVGEDIRLKKANWL